MNKLDRIHISGDGYIKATMIVGGIGEVTRRPKLSKDLIKRIEAECLLDLNKALGIDELTPNEGERKGNELVS